MLASNIPIGTRVRWNRSLPKPMFATATIISNKSRQGDEVIVVETDGEDHIIMSCNVNDVVPVFPPSAQLIAEQSMSLLAKQLGSSFVMAKNGSSGFFVDSDGQKYGIAIAVRAM